jgi:hypothetical protein
MSVSRERCESQSDDNPNSLPSQGTPGKRTRTEGLSARDFADRAFDQAHSGEDYYEARATVEAQSTPDTRPKLSGRKLVRAMRKNPRWMALYPEAPRFLREFRTDTDEFALDVAAKQKERGVEIDGIAGPKTLEALLGAVPKRTLPPGTPASRSGGRRRGSAPGDEHTHQASSGGERFAGEDPFATHLLGDLGANVADLGGDPYEIPDMTGLED